MNDEEMNTDGAVGVDPVGVDPSIDPRQSEDLNVKCAEYLSGWKRALADYENLKKSNVQTRDDDRRRVRMSVADDLLPVIDNFGYVTKHIPDSSNCDPEFKKKFDTWVAGIGHIDRQFGEVLKGLGVEPIEALGKPFDAKFHEAGGSRKDESKPDGEVLEEVIKGWKFGEVVLRPAKVIINEK
ncbi:MAG: nucleotide exchange factor GrpE [Patescibacteria group bacterium]|jgi:molecular chaperone GrpE